MTQYLDTTYLKVIYNSNNNVKLLLIVKRQFVDVLAWVCRSDHAWHASMSACVRTFILAADEKPFLANLVK